MQLKSIIKYLNFEFIDLYQLSVPKIRPSAEKNSNIISCSSEYGFKQIFTNYVLSGQHTILFLKINSETN